YRVHGSNMSKNVRAMEHDMLLAFAKAFASGDPALRRLRRLCYSNLHAMLAGSFLAVGQYRKFLSHSVPSVLLHPHGIRRTLSYPIRRWRKKGSPSRGHAQRTPASS